MIGRIKCKGCKNFIEKNISPTPWKCTAFPNGIPEKNLMYITRDPCVNCNNGIGYEPIDSEAQELFYNSH